MMHQGIAAALIAVGLATAGWGFNILLSDNSPFLLWVGPILITAGLALVGVGVAWLAWPLMRERRNGDIDAPPTPAPAQAHMSTSEATRLNERGAAALNNIGAVYEDQGHYDQALSQYQQALVIAREIGARELEEAVLNNFERLPSSDN